MALPNVASGDPHVAAHNAERQLINQLENLTGVEVFYNATTGWPARPTNSSSVIVRWIGGTSATPPVNHIPGVDLWFVPVGASS